MTMIDTADGASDAVARYLRFWNCDPGPDQRALAAATFREDVRYRAPLGDRDGVAQLLELSREFAEHLGDVAFRPRLDPETVGNRVRLRWEILLGDDSFAEGTDVIELDTEGRIAAVTTFLDRPPEGFDPHAQREARA